MNVLLFSVSIGSGHDLAAQAIEQEIIKRYPDAQTKIVDTFKYINPVLNKVVVGSYMESLKFNPKIWGFLYQQAEEGEKFVDITQLLSNLVSPKLNKLVKNFSPDVIICTHAFPSGILSVLKGREKIQVPLITVLTDYTVHPFWIHKYIDTYVIPADELKYVLLEQGVPEEKIKTFGLPIRSEFTLPVNKQEARKELGLVDKITVLVMGGGLGLGAIKQIIYNLGYADLDIQIIVVAGKNNKLRTQLDLMKLKNPIKVLGFVTEVHKLMAASDLIITKPGGLTTAEVLSKALPMIITSPLPGQEDRNTEFLLNNGLAKIVRKEDQLVLSIKQLINNPLRMKQMREMATSLAKPQAAKDLVDFIENISLKG